MRHYHEPAGPSETNDPAGWDRASYTPDLLAELGEPLPEPVNRYRQAALYHLQLMYAVDDFITAAKDARFAVIVVASCSDGRASAVIPCPRLPTSWASPRLR